LRVNSVSVAIELWRQCGLKALGRRIRSNDAHVFIDDQQPSRMLPIVVRTTSYAKLSGD
jgi:hypothetical protein